MLVFFKTWNFEVWNFLKFVNFGHLELLELLSLDTLNSDIWHFLTLAIFDTWNFLHSELETWNLDVKNCLGHLAISDTWNNCLILGL